MSRNPNISAQDHLKERVRYQYKLANILNLGKAEFPGEGPFDIPILRPTYELPEIKGWINFDQVLQDKNPEGKAVHFFVEDYRFERIWSHPDRYMNKLSKYAAVCSPEFSVFGDMPFALQIFNHYRKHWVGAYMQSKGITVIATITPNLNLGSQEWFLDGEPREGIVAMSCRMTKTSEQKNRFYWQYSALQEGLHPKKVFLYGPTVPDLVGDVEFIPPFTKTQLRKRVPNRAGS